MTRYVIAKHRPHNHRTLVPGCYRCELDKYEATLAFEAITGLPAMQPGDSVRVTMRDDGGFDVVPLSGMDRWEWPYPSRFEGRPLWVDATEQENDR